MLLLLTIHTAAAIAAPLMIRRWGRNAFLALAAVPAAAAVWGSAHLSTVSDGRVVTESFAWVSTLGMDIDLRYDALAALMTLLVGGVGALVFIYCARYFENDETGLARFAGVLMAFAGSMLALVVADNLLVLYVAWELTTVFSYLLIGHTPRRKASRRAAIQALMITTAGGLALLTGFIILGEGAGTYSLMGILEAPPSGTAVTWAVVLVLFGALSKSAIFPTQFWLPAAMSAPTPVSAYLHAAAMVKAGIYLTAALAPAFAGVVPWRWMVIVLGGLTMVIGGWRALRENDLKLLLAYGTVSQLGLLMVLVGSGTRDIALAGVAMLVAHALFKATLFLVVGIIDHATGTRDARRLDMLFRQTPLLAVVSVIAAGSMAGLPPLAGFVGKEAAFETLLHPGLPDHTASIVTLVTIAVGSALTVAYSIKFVWGAFGPGEEGGHPTAEHISPLSYLAPVLLAGLTLVAGVGASALEAPLAAYADTFPATAEKPYHLALWHGLSPALGISVLCVAAGIAIYRLRRPLLAARSKLPFIPPGDGVYRASIRALDRVSVNVTAYTQRGSLPLYLTVILVTLMVLSAVVIVRAGTWPQGWYMADSAIQVLVAGVAAIASGIALRAKQRMAAVLLVSVTGYAAGVIFALHGAPDLALTQFLVETLTLVVFVLVLRKLPKNITDRHNKKQRRWRLLVAVPFGVIMSVAAAIAVSARQATPISQWFPDQTYSFGGGKNVVNVTLVDVRAWDTLGEISVLVVAATGVASLIFLRHRTGTPPRPEEDAEFPELAVAGAERTRGGGPSEEAWLRWGRLVAPERRSVILEVVTRFIFHTIVVLSIYLLFAGHNVPGGGFAGGLVAGLALVVRYLAGGRYELGEAAPVDAGLILGLGLLLAGGTGVTGLVIGADVLQSAIVQTSLPVLGDIKLVTSIFFDIGVYLVVVGLVLDVLRSLGAELDRQEDAS